MNTMHEQLAMFPPVDEKAVRRVVAKELKKYKALRVAVQNKQEQAENGIVQLFPQVHQSEKQNDLKARQIERALQYSLDEIERKIIEEKYLSLARVNDINVYLDLGLTKNQFYIKKREAIFQLATALRII
ncbi:ArpU family transcriptional regulator [Brevibacillus laterosporus]|uniref:ArpU family transcriptional regulator n=1 Tax=Brevibacillus halotolerans TaxID=1507437 RepID=A0ABT4I3L1_9BACL|nr:MULTISPECIES: ArpU family phage packaging/lysis transcriptional regulator [Brevibacillus]MCR8987912.1 ArpU family transcriptional regulator [Brevibacillus laterosporus]MCZ0833651.1 ArpU family transcriptional regulator [Brevibacillus halotolerans]